MAVLKSFGKAENDPGQWWPFGATGIEVRVRHIPPSEAEKIAKRYGKETFVVVDGVRKPVTERTQKQIVDLLMDQATWAWTDVRGLDVEMADAEAAAKWAKMLGHAVDEGSVVSLEGKLNAEVKRHVLGELVPQTMVERDPEDITPESPKTHESQTLAAFVVLRAARMAKEALAAEENVQKN